MQQIVERVSIEHGINISGGSTDSATLFYAFREFRQEFRKRDFSEEEIMHFVAEAIDSAARDPGLTDTQRATIISVFSDAFEVDVRVKSKDGLTAQYQLTPRTKH